jgi:hypothetical protein
VAGSQAGADIEVALSDLDDGEETEGETTGDGDVGVEDEATGATSWVSVIGKLLGTRQGPGKAASSPAHRSSTMKVVEKRVQRGRVQKAVNGERRRRYILW